MEGAQETLQQYEMVLGKDGKKARVHETALKKVFIEEKEIRTRKVYLKKGHTEADALCATLEKERKIQQ